MGLFGMMKFAHTHHLIKRRALRAPAGCFTPIAVDLWNVMYTLVLKYQRRYPTYDREAMTLRCLCSLLRVFAQKALYPIFVTDRGVDCTEAAVFGAKAILTHTTTQCRTDEEASDMDSSPPGSPISDARPSTAFSNMRRRGYSADAGLRPQAPAAGGSAAKPALKLAHRFCIRLLRALGYAYINSGRMEADDACANLYHTNTVAYVHTTDTDLLLMGCDIVLDISPCYIPTIHCRDLLSYFKMSYPQFLALFVRCHTDLHPNNTQASVDDVLRECGWTPPGRARADAEGQGTARPWRPPSPPVFETRISWTDILSRQLSGADADPDDDDDVPALDPPEPPQEPRGRAPPKARSSSEILTPPELVTVPEAQLVAEHRDYVRRRRRHVLHDAAEAVDWLPEPMTITELVELRYVKYVISIIAPKRRGPWVLLKRLPIYQDARDEDLARSLVNQHITTPDIAAGFLHQLWTTVPSPPPPYQTVLAKFWDE
ncbi:tegument host shutoff protein [Macacine alphaherpesvirus 3]|uniref:Virion host shutoff protein n=1 Tax=Macacine alphaherpesvirus 3 TaxID=2845555 RepID=A0A1X9WFC8_9ALPH|nr:tegument host shutoff protein [Macacine alphaherpesvirus 1]ARS01828.1 tegument host shutoff protein [Macacine alphaherpesvirus 3]